MIQDTAAMICLLVVGHKYFVFVREVAHAVATEIRQYGQPDVGRIILSIVNSGVAQHSGAAYFYSYRVLPLR